MLSSRPADDKHSFGYHRLEVIAALANGLTLVVVSIGIRSEAIQRFREPQPVRGVEMLVIAAIGLLANLAVARILHGHEHQEGNEFARKDLNVRSAFLHVVRVRSPRWA